MPHGGQAQALNAVIPLCRGDWIAFLESDDVWDVGKLAEVAAAIRGRPDLVAVQHCMTQADANLRPMPTVITTEPVLWGMDDYLTGKSLITGLSALTARRDAIAKLLPFPTDLHTSIDGYLHAPLLKHGSMLHLAGSWGLRRVHGANLYAGIRSDLKRLSLHLSLRDKLDAYGEAFLQENGLILAEDCRRRNRQERRELELFRHRLEGRVFQALGDYAQVLALCNSLGYAIFKAAALGAALISPALYLKLYDFYESRRLVALRQRIFPRVSYFSRASRGAMSRLTSRICAGAQAGWWRSRRYQRRRPRAVSSAGAGMKVKR